MPPTAVPQSAGMHALLRLSTEIAAAPAATAAACSNAGGRSNQRAALHCTPDALLAVTVFFKRALYCTPNAELAVTVFFKWGSTGAEGNGKLALSGEPGHC